MEEIRPSHKAFCAPIPPLKRPDGSTALDDAEVAECIADSIETQCSHPSPPHDPAHISRIEEEVLQKTSLDPRDDLTPVSLSEVQTLVKSLKTRKAPGLDGISNKAIKRFPQQLLRLLVAIFNACLQNYYFPPVWKEAEVIGIHKPGKPLDLPASYRPISLLSGLAKLYERVLKTRLTDHLLGKGLIIDEQFGFRPAHSCPQQVLRLVEYATEGFKRKNQTVSVFFDVAKAFDRSRDLKLNSLYFEKTCAQQWDHTPRDARTRVRCISSHYTGLRPVRHRPTDATKKKCHVTGRHTRAESKQRVLYDGRIVLGVVFGDALQRQKYGPGRKIYTFLRRGLILERFEIFVHLCA
ncbi:Probable RNA-directed DNA polymerase from transposon BS [Eumeta japonica]|uniref:Probable RNA-directed DNA polymerase from transposon BS n=1 Tax=Eumeta variegata TaxID=151549 RepID=A0A4C1W008_EUMVA|nr:Probable RNA-directed DNA polymerase from transposon BS [Eumeta japonica]